jgi:hypothetical protein
MALLRQCLQELRTKNGEHETPPASPRPASTAPCRRSQKASMLLPWDKRAPRARHRFLTAVAT